VLQSLHAGIGIDIGTRFCDFSRLNKNSMLDCDSNAPPASPYKNLHLLSVILDIKRDPIQISSKVHFTSDDKQLEPKLEEAP